MGREFERDVVKKTIASGAIDWDPADIKTAKYLAELKSTFKKSYTLSYMTLLKIYNQALSQGKVPICILRIQDLMLTARITKISARLKQEDK